MGIRVTVSATLKGGVAEGGGVSEKSSATTTLFLKGGGGGGSSGSAVFKVAEIGRAKARPDLLSLARRLDRLAPSSTRPEDYFAEKSEIANALRRMKRARAKPIPGGGLPSQQECRKMIDYQVRAEDDLGEKIGPRIKVDGKDSHTIVPAQPGFTVVTARTDDEGRVVGLFHTAVVAWLITVEVWKEQGPDGEEERMFTPTPITAEPIQGGDRVNDLRAVRQSDGRIIFPLCTCDDETAALEYFEEMFAQHTKARLPSSKIN